MASRTTVKVGSLEEAEDVIRAMTPPDGEPDPVVPPPSRPPFDPKPYIIKIQGKEYLPVRARLLWMRYDHGSDWGITTEMLRDSARDDVVCVRAVIRDRMYATPTTDANNHWSFEELPTVATGLASAPLSGKFAALMKAETAAIGRALAHAGYGTEFIDDEDEVVDGPVSAPAAPPPPATLWREWAGLTPETLEAQMKEDLWLIRQQGTAAHLDSWRRHYSSAPEAVRNAVRPTYNETLEFVSSMRRG